MKKTKQIDPQQYKEKFGIKDTASTCTKTEKAFEVMLATRQFEIQMYWTRTAYFWAIAGATFAGYFALQTSSIDLVEKKFLSYIISIIGIVLSLGWGLANKGSKYWQENWENHVQLLEDSVVGPVFKTLLERGKSKSKCKAILEIIIGPSKYSVSKINLIFSWFFLFLWGSLLVISLPQFDLAYDIDWKYVYVSFIGGVFVIILLLLGQSSDTDQKHTAKLRKTYIDQFSN